MGKLSRRFSPMTLFLLSMNGIVGSGWLFAPLYAAKIAGSAAIFSWLIGGVAVALVSLTFAELSTILPVAGGTAHIPQLSHGTFVSFVMSWIAWISSLLLTPIEVQAVLQYAALFFPNLMYTLHGVPNLSLIGYFWAGVLMILLCLVNIVSFKGLIRFNFLICIFKFSVIFLTIFLIIKQKFAITNFSSGLSAITTANGWHNILSAVATGGIILAFNGFKSSVELAGEAKKLSIAIPLSTIGCVLACMLLYFALQSCFIGALDSQQISAGWQHLSLEGDLGPFVLLASGLGLFALVKLLYFNAVISPLGAGLIYVTSTARILYAMSRIGYVPKFLSHLNHQKMPVLAILVNFLIGMLCFLPLPGWQAMANFLISGIVITYAMGPIALVSLRLSLPNMRRPFKLPGATFISLIAFYFCNLFSYWTGWETISKLFLVIAVGLIIFFIAYFRGAIKVDKAELKSLFWMIPYLVGLILMSYLGSFGGVGLIPFGWDFLVIGIFSLFIFQMAVFLRLKLKEESISEFLTNEGLVPQTT